MCPAGFPSTHGPRSNGARCPSGDRRPNRGVCSLDAASYLRQTADYLCAIWPRPGRELRLVKPGRTRARGVHGWGDYVGILFLPRSGSLCQETYSCAMTLSASWIGYIDSALTSTVTYECENVINKDPNQFVSFYNYQPEQTDSRVILTLRPLTI